MRPRTKQVSAYFRSEPVDRFEAVREAKTRQLRSEVISMQSYRLTEECVEELERALSDPAFRDTLGMV